MEAEKQAVSIEVATAEFRAGVTAVLRAWSALRTAVQSEWGGVQSREKAEFIRNQIYESFDYTKSKPSMDRYDLEDALAIYLEEEFCVQVEDDSEKEVAYIICKMYDSCGNGDFSLARDRIAKSKEAVLSAGKVVVKSEGELDEESDDEEMEESSQPHQEVSGLTMTEALDFASDFLFGPPPGQARVVNSGPIRQLGEAPHVIMQPEVDEDGFMTVPIRKRK